MSDNNAQSDAIEVPSRNINGTQLDTVEVSLGETVAVCRCTESNVYPLCDGSHQTCAVKIYPAVIKVVEE